MCIRDRHMMTVHLFGGVSSPSCANFALRKTDEDNKALFDPQIIHTVQRNFYVHDSLKSVKSDHDAINLVKDLLKKGGFHLTKWLSNSRQVIQSIPESKRATSVMNLDFAPIERALGMQWCIYSDTFGFSTAIKDHPAISCLSPHLSSLLKSFSKELCKKKLDWDENITENLSR